MHRRGEAPGSGRMVLSGVAGTRVTQYAAWSVGSNIRVNNQGRSQRRLRMTSEVINPGYACYKQ